jgi:outer membrane protein assembly factor BamB
MRISFIAFLVGLTFSGSSFAADWLQFRGPGASGISLEPAAGLPTKLDIGSSIAWEAGLPGKGLSSPIVIGKKVFLTCSSGPEQNRLHVICFHADTGASIWDRTFRASGRTICHNKTAVAAPTPVSDGKRIFALFSSNDLFCLDLDGNLLWLRGLTQDYPNASNGLGMASSPVVVGKVLVAQIENDSESFAAGFDVESGENIWKFDRPKAANWTSPIVFEDGGKSLVGLQSSKGLLAVDPATGKEAWNIDGGASTIPSSAVGDGMVFIPSRGTTAFKLTGGEPEEVWQKTKLRPETASPLVVGSKVFVLNSNVLKCAEAKTGEDLWSIRLEAGAYAGSPVAAGNLLYLFNEKGIAQVVDVSGDGEGVIVGGMELGEMIQCTPAIANGALFVRSNSKLWKLTGSAADRKP